MANGFDKDLCEWYCCGKEPEVAVTAHPYGTVVVCQEHAQCIPMAREKGLEWRHDVLRAAEE